MNKDKLDEFIRKETQGPSLGQQVGGAALIGALVGVAKVLCGNFKTK